MRGPGDLLAWRDEFPAVSSTVFLGSHTLAPLSRRARAALDRFLDAWQTKASAERVWFEDIIPEMRRAEHLFASLIGADDDEVALSPSVTTALASLASCLDFAARDEIVLSRREFPTDSLVWLAQERRGARVIWVDGSSASDYVGAVGERTAAVSASRVSYLDGEITDVATVARAARGAGALFVVDDFHGTGVVPIEVHTASIDALVCGPYKYLLGSSNVGFVYVRRGLAETLHPTITGWFAQQDFFAFDGSRIDHGATAQRFALGTPSAMSVFTAVAGLSIVAEIGVARIRSRSLELTGYLIERATDAGLVVRTPREPERRGGLVAFEVPESKHVLEQLLARDVIVDERHGALRACPHFFSSEDDIDALFDALADVGALG